MKALVAAVSLLVLPVLSWAGWDTATLQDESTLDFLTVNPQEGEHWSRVWLVVIDGQVYIRLGSRAAQRIEANTSAPFVKVRVAGKEYDRVRAEPAAEQAGAVARAMGEKYWTDLLIRHFRHPLTMRLIPEGAGQ